MKKKTLMAGIGAFTAMAAVSTAIDLAEVMPKPVVVAAHETAAVYTMPPLLDTELRENKDISNLNPKTAGLVCETLATGAGVAALSFVALDDEKKRRLREGVRAFERNLQRQR
jgi:hypothetical protein